MILYGHEFKTSSQREQTEVSLPYTGIRIYLKSTIQNTVIDSSCLKLKKKRISPCTGCNPALSESSLWTLVLARDQEGI